MITHVPVKRLRDCSLGDQVNLVGVPRSFVFSHIEGEYGVLINKAKDSEWRVKASLGHEVIDV